jgi:hypothetical protein
MKVFRDLMRDRWYSRELIRSVERGPGAMSFYFSLVIGLLSSFLSFAYMKDMETASVVVSCGLVFLSLNFVIYDLWSYVQRHGLLLLRHVARRCANRMTRLQVESDSISGFLDRLYTDPELEGLFRTESNESVQTVVKALDRLSETAIRYGARGKRVFERNLEPFLAAEMLMRPLRGGPTSDLLGPELKRWLEEVPYYDPEGWSLASTTGPLPCCLPNDSAR